MKTRFLLFVVMMTMAEVVSAGTGGGGNGTVPEPSVFGFLALSAGALALIKWKNRRKK